MLGAASFLSSVHVGSNRSATRNHWTASSGLSWAAAIRPRHWLSSVSAGIGSPAATLSRMRVSFSSTSFCALSNSWFVYAVRSWSRFCTCRLRPSSMPSTPTGTLISMPLASNTRLILEAWAPSLLVALTRTT
jgi:hypothetical protein